MEFGVVQAGRILVHAEAQSRSLQGMTIWAASRGDDAVFAGRWG